MCYDVVIWLKKVYLPTPFETLLANPMIDVLLPLAFASAGSVVVAVQQILDRFGKVIRLLALLEEQNRRLEEKSNETLRALEELRRQDDNHGTRIADIERYLQCITANLDNPFVIRYDGNHYHDDDNRPG